MTERILDRNGSPVQQSMTLRPNDYIGLNISRMMLGVVMEVYPADDSRNRSAYQREDRRGYLHSCTVLVIQDGRGTYLPLENVIITPDAPSGLDDYHENLPRGCSALVTGESWNSQLNHINPYNLDGDWCIVGFLGGSIDQPFIVRWWPHSHNPFDPATSGQTNPNAAGEGETLNQAGRMFHRINGVEFTVTKEGNVYLSTYRANSALRFGGDLSPIDGRFPRTLQDTTGGSVKLWVKPSQSFELDWNTPVDGMGVLDVAEEGIPQTNPSESASSSRAAKDNTYILIEKDRMDITVPDEFKLVSKRRILLESQEETTLTVGGDFSCSVDGDLSCSVGGSSATDVIGDLSIGTDGELSISSVGRATIAGEDSIDITAPFVNIVSEVDTVTVRAPHTRVEIGSVDGDVIIGNTPQFSVSVSPTVVKVGDGTLGGAVGGTWLMSALAQFALSVRIAAASSTDLAFANGVANACDALYIGVSNAVSPNVKVG